MKYYYESFSKKFGWGWKVYHWDESGNHEIVVGKSHLVYDTEEKALDGATDWCEENDIDAELA